MKKRAIIAMAVLLIAIGLTGCDRSAPEVSGVAEVVEFDCGIPLNLEEYLNDNLQIKDETDEGSVEYNLVDLEYSITCDEAIYNAETGDIDTSNPGEYPVTLTVKDLSNNKTTLEFSIKLNQLKMEGSVEDVLEMDCGTPFNVLEYLNENFKITGQGGDKEYKLEELEYSIDCDDSVYNSETGEYNTEKYGENKVALVMPGNSVEGGNVVFSVKVNPLKIESAVEEILEIDCGTPLNIFDYLKENVKITNQAGDAEFKMDDFEYSIDCDESVFNSNTGDFDTSKFGEYKTTFTIDSESFENNKIAFTIKLNPLVIDKGYYVYKNEFADGYEYLGFCEYKNTSSENLEVNSIEFRFFDKDEVLIGSSDMPDYSREYLESGASGYALDTFSSFNSSISSSDEIVRVDVVIDYEKTSGKDTRSLEVGEMEITNNYEYNVSHFAGTTIVTNPYEQDVEYFSLLAGMYDSEGKLIGVMSSMDTNTIVAGSKSRCTAAWLPDPRAIPDKVASLKASARVTSFVGEY